MTRFLVPLFVLLCTEVYAIGEDNVFKVSPLPELCYFEDETDVSRWASSGAKIELSEEHVTQGRHSAKLIFFGKEEPSIGLSHPAYSTKDWSDYAMLAVDVYNPNNFLVPLYLKIRFENGEVHQISETVQAQQGMTCFYSLLLPVGFLCAEHLWQNDKIVSVTFVRGKPDKWIGEGEVKTDEETVLFLDNIRLITMDEARLRLNIPAPLTESELKNLPAFTKKEIKISAPDTMTMAHFRALKILWLNEEDVPDPHEFGNIGIFPVLRTIIANHVQCRIGKPNSLEELKKYDVVVFENIGPEHFSDEQLKWIKEFWLEGGAVAMFGGRASFAGKTPGSLKSYKDTPIADCLPVEILSRPDMSIDTPNFEFPDPNHPVIRDVPWESWVRLQNYNIVKEKPETETLARQKGTNTPLLVIGKNSLAFTPVGTETYSGAWHMSGWEGWTWLIAQAFSYVTRHHLFNRVVIGKIEMPTEGIIGEALPVEVSVVNLGSQVRQPTLIMNLSSHEEDIFSDKEIQIPLLSGGELHSHPFKFHLPENFEPGEYELQFMLKDKKDTLDTFMQKIKLTPGISIEINLPKLPAVQNEGFFPEVTIKNRTVEPENVTVRLWLEKDGKNVKSLFNKKVSIPPKGEEVLRHNLSLTGLNAGGYHLCSLLTKGNEKIDIVKKKFRVYKPFSERDFFYLAEGILDIRYDMAFDPLFTELDFFRTSYGPLDINYLWMAISPVSSWRTLKEKDEIKNALIPHLKELAERQLPFYIFLWWGWSHTEPYPLMMEKVKAIIDWAEKIGGKYFLGVISGEQDAIFTYRAVADAKTRIEKADTYIKILNKIIKDMDLAPGKIFMPIVAYMLNWGLDYEAGSGVVLQESITALDCVPMGNAQLRGIARSFEKKWGTDIAMDNFGTVNVEGPFLWNLKTGRYDPDMASRKLKNEERLYPTLEDAYKIFIEKYYHGVNYLDHAYEMPLHNGMLCADGRMILKFMDFIEANPRCKDIVTSTAVLRSKGDYWRGPYRGKGKGIGEWFYNGNPLKEEVDFQYLTLFFPDAFDFQENGGMTKYYWTGTPYGQIDIIYPYMKWDGMKRYNSIIFLGYHRMDSVRDDFIEDLMRYVREGGVVVLSCDQLRDSQDRLNFDKYEEFTGAGLSESRSEITGSIEVKKTTPFGFRKEIYETEIKVNFKDEKNAWAYKVRPKKAKVVAQDAHGMPLLLINQYGKGYVLLFTTPTISMIPPQGKSEIVSDVLDKVAKFKGLPTSLLPTNNTVEFLISKTGDEEATVFIMNHGGERWEGDIIIDLKAAGLRPGIIRNVSANVSRGYEIETIKPDVVVDGKKVVIKGISLQGDTARFDASATFTTPRPHEPAHLDTKEFISYRQASFAIIKLGKE